MTDNQGSQTSPSPQLEKSNIAYDDFAKLDLRVATILAAEPIPGADKLLKITLDAGELGERTVAAGIKAWYQPEDLLGKKVVYLANLAPRTLRGVESQGMIIAAGEAEAILLHPDRAVEAGTKVR
jgi:methionine--tRNA ligase beta chain